jgi:hypothetical protein
VSAVKTLLWKAIHRKWRPRGPAVPGYSLLVPVPGDLPVFLKIALNVLRRQDATDRVETLVVPDVATPAVRAIVAEQQPTWPGELRLVELPRPDRWVPRLVNRPHHNHWLQLINGAEHARGEFALLHDADLFIHDPTFLREQFQRCRAGNFACFGVHRVWDDWYAQRGRDLTATWEMFFSVDWLRSFPPHLHLGHDGTLDGEPHTFDTTLDPQCRTPAGRIGWHTPAGGLTHFNYVICTYRYFRARKGRFADDSFRILLIETLGKTFQEAADVPLGDVHYETATPAAYAEFRSKCAELIAGNLLTDSQKSILMHALAPFDKRFVVERRFEEASLKGLTS